MSDSHALFCCFALTILRMTSVDFFHLMLNKPDFVLSLSLIICCQDQGFCCHKTTLNYSPGSSVLENP